MAEFLGQKLAPVQKYSGKYSILKLRISIIRTGGTYVLKSCSDVLNLKIFAAKSTYRETPTQEYADAERSRGCNQRRLNSPLMRCVSGNRGVCNAKLQMDK